MNKQQNKSNDSKTIFIASFTFLDKNIRVPDMRQFQRLRSVLVFSSNRLTSKPCLYILHAVWEISAPTVNQKKVTYCQTYIRLLTSQYKVDKIRQQDELTYGCPLAILWSICRYTFVDLVTLIFGLHNFSTGAI